MCDGWSVQSLADILKSIIPFQAVVFNLDNVHGFSAAQMSDFVVSGFGSKRLLCKYVSEFGKTEVITLKRCNQSFL